jgi:hypothetical protein
VYDIVIITSYNRPDYLRLCLEYLSRAQGIADKEIWICVDRGRTLIREFYEVLVDFQKSLHIVTKFRPEHSYRGNSYNTLEAYKEAYQTDAKFIYLVEDDVLVQPDFFTWHESVQTCGNFMCSVAFRCSRNAEARTDIVDPEAYFTTAKDYASIGVCWRRERLLPVIKHAVSEYYSDLEGYLTQHFQNNRFCTSFSEQDGLIMRVMGETNGVTIWPYNPRCFHIGFSGYNRLRGSRYTTAELREIIHDPLKVAVADRDFHDIEPVPTSPVPDWSPCNLHRLQHFD